MTESMTRQVDRGIKAGIRICLSLFLVFSLCTASISQSINDVDRHSSGTTRGAQPEFGLYLDIRPAVVTVGDPVHLHLKSDLADFNEDNVLSVDFEPDEETWHVERDWRRVLSEDSTGGDKGWMAELRPFDMGDPDLPPVVVSLDIPGSGTVELRLDDYHITVNSVRQDTAEKDELYGLRNPVNPPVDRTGLWLSLIVIILVLLTGWFVYRRWKNRRLESGPDSAPEELLPPGLWALEELDRRSRLSVCRKGPVKITFTHVSEVVRIYLGRRYEINAMDLTTIELLNALAIHSPGNDVMRWVREFLEECDSVKFTTLEPPRDRWVTIWNDARLIVKMTTSAAELTGDPEPDNPLEQELGT
jgi:hypothetical protein